MRKLLVIVLVLIATVPAFAQTTKEKKNKEILSQAGDHLMVQFSTDFWLGAPDSIKNHIKGVGRGFNAYAMLNKPFNADPRFSVAFGLGVGTSSMYFKKMTVELAATKVILPFTALDTTDHFKKFKVVNTFVDVPIEFRFSSNPANQNKSIKVALGMKVGTMLNAHSKGKALQNASGTTINNYIEKASTKRFFNTTRFAVTTRIGYGNFTLFGSYTITSLFKDAVAADMKVLQVGLTFSGL